MLVRISSSFFSYDGNKMFRQKLTVRHGGEVTAELVTPTVRSRRRVSRATAQLTLCFIWFRISAQGSFPPTLVRTSPSTNLVRNLCPACVLRGTSLANF